MVIQLLIDKILGQSILRRLVFCSNLAKPKLDGLRVCGRDASIFQACDFAFLLTYRTIFLMDKHYHLLAYRKKSIYNRN